ncbi:hypothetical protein F7Q99_05395 [Streptomyces kaniharaensis]|uniref:Uncharacterized protein n=1 Tax=Streptomyces kaniharaensis TaxID=212423 RepID=A0A6N7KMQ0_9ACTN|nr:hypothetical protein [Streptomyces kaniharaensis]MQS11738.1 hypothetical protein [Streptomyces kaniharaensis]
MTRPRTSGAPRPTAGALRLVEGRSENPTSVNVSAYVIAVGQHCPFLPPSVDRQLTGWTVYEIGSTDRNAVETELFHAGVQAAEWIRPLKTRPHGVLTCENVVILGSVPDTSHQELMRRPYWALRNLYAPVGVLFGKFSAGRHETDRFGRAIPPPPFSFLPVRAAVTSRDPRFLASTPDMAKALAAADDDGRDVFEHIPCDWKAVRAWASSLPVPTKR